MFNISAPDLLVLVVAALFILGPERIPGAARWLGRSVRKAREYATGARDQLEAEVGEDFDELRKPLQNIAKLRTMNPRQAIARHLLDATSGYDPRQDLDEITSTIRGSITARGSQTTTDTYRQAALAPGERAPFDPDAT